MPKRKEINYNTIFDYDNLCDKRFDYSIIRLINDYYITAFELYNNNKYVEAILYLEKILKLNENHISVYKLYLKIYSKQNDLINIEITLKQIIKLSPIDWFYYYALGILYVFKLEDNNNGEIILLQALKLNPTNKNIYNILIHIYANYNNLFAIKNLHTNYKFDNKIITEINKSLYNIECDMKQFFDINITIQNQSNLLIAENKYLEYFLKNQNDINILFLIAKFYFRVYNYEKSIYFAEKLVEINNTFIEIKYLLLTIYYKQNKIDKLKNMCLDIISINKLYFIANYYLGLIYYNNGEYDKALLECNIIFKVDKNNIKTLLLVGDIYIKQQLKKEAIIIYNSILKLEPDNDIAFNAIIELV